MSSQTTPKYLIDLHGTRGIDLTKAERFDTGYNGVDPELGYPTALSQSCQNLDELKSKNVAIASNRRTTYLAPTHSDTSGISISLDDFDAVFWEELAQKRYEERALAGVSRIPCSTDPQTVIEYTDPRDLYLLSMANAADMAKAKGYTAVAHTRKEVKSLLLAERAEAKYTMARYDSRLRTTHKRCYYDPKSTALAKEYYVLLKRRDVHKDKYDYITQHMEDLIALWLRLIGAPSEAPKPAARHETLQAKAARWQQTQSLRLEIEALKVKHAKEMFRLKARHAKEMLELKAKHLKGH